MTKLASQKLETYSLSRAWLPLMLCPSHFGTINQFFLNVEQLAMSYEGCVYSHHSSYMMFGTIYL